MTTDPFLITGPALISFSGGRTSAYMLWRILQAHGGTLPDDVVVAFANTGKEREETLRFVHECGSRWRVHVRWVEWRPPNAFEEVGFNSADRTGKWFAELIRRKQYLPNSTMRYCTSKLKVDAMKKFMMSLGYTAWVNPVGLRYDEGHRVLKQLARNESKKERYTAVMPLATARITKRNVMAFWATQPFDLQLQPHEGNCDLCFLKGRVKLAAIIHEHPDLAGWWSGVEVAAKTKMPDLARFRAEESYAQLAAAVKAQQVFDFEADEHDAECGLWCAGEAV
jgi:hypothetical protein